MHTSTLHFWLWFGALGVLPPLVLLPAWRPSLRLVGVVGPGVIGALLWLHGVWLDPPNNFAVLDEYGFFGFWFKPHRGFEYDEGMAFLALISLPAAFVIPWLLISLRRSQTATSAVLAAWPAWVLGFLFLRGIPDELVDSLHHADHRLFDPARFVDGLLPLLLIRAVFAVGPLALAVFLWTRGTRAPPRTTAS